MYLGKDGARKFFKLWLPLLRHVNTKHQLFDSVPSGDNPASWKPNETLRLRNKLWENPELFESYINAAEHRLTASEKSLLVEWGNRRKEEYVVLKHLSRYTVFLSHDRVYGVIGITNPITEMIAAPAYAKAVLLPFEGKIVYDSFLESYAIRLGRGTREDLNHKYRTLKGTKGICTSLSEGAL
jgi:hypothetical protein